MAITNTFCRLAATRPDSTDEFQLYVVPAATEINAVLRICNQDSTARAFTIMHCAAGHGNNVGLVHDRIYFLKNIEAYETIEISIHANATETLRAAASVAEKISFVLEGQKKVTS